MKLLLGSEEIECNAITNETTQSANTRNVDNEITDPAGTAKNFCITLPWSVYLFIRPESDEQPQRLKPLWCKIFTISLTQFGHSVR